MHDCWRLESPYKGRFISSDSEDDNSTIGTLDDKAEMNNSHYSDTKLSIKVPNASVASTSKSSAEAQICAAQWFVNEVELEVYEDDCDPDEFNRTR